MANSPLFSILRDGIAEITVFGEVVAVSDGKRCFQSSEAVGVYPARSLLKAVSISCGQCGSETMDELAESSGGIDIGQRISSTSPTGLRKGNGTLLRRDETPPFPSDG